MTTPIDPYSQATAAFPQSQAVTQGRIAPSFTVPGVGVTIATLNNLGLALGTTVNPVTAATATALITGGTAGTPMITLPSQFNGFIPNVQTNTSAFTVTGTGSGNQLTVVYTVDAGDANTATIYRLTAGGHGTWGSTQQPLNLQISAFGITAGNFTIGALQFNANANFDWTVIGYVIIVSTGTAGSLRGTLSGILSLDGASLLSGTGNNATVGADGFTSTSAVDTTVSQSITLQGGWGSTTGAPTITCSYSILERLGQ